MSCKNSLLPITSTGLLVIKDNQNVYNFQSNQATFEAWILFFEICKKKEVGDVVKYIPV